MVSAEGQTLTQMSGIGRGPAREAPASLSTNRTRSRIGGRAPFRIGRILVRTPCSFDRPSEEREPAQEAPDRKMIHLVVPLPVRGARSTRTPSHTGWRHCARQTWSPTTTSHRLVPGSNALLVRTTQQRTRAGPRGSGHGDDPPRRSVPVRGARSTRTPSHTGWRLCAQRTWSPTTTSHRLVPGSNALLVRATQQRTRTGPRGSGLRGCSFAGGARRHVASGRTRNGFRPPLLEPDGQPPCRPLPARAARPIHAVRRRPPASFATIGIPANPALARSTQQRTRAGPRGSGPEADPPRRSFPARLARPPYSPATCRSTAVRISDSSGLNRPTRATFLDDMLDRLSARTEPRLADSRVFSSRNRPGRFQSSVLARDKSRLGHTCSAHAEREPERRNSWCTMALRVRVEDGWSTRWR